MNLFAEAGLNSQEIKDMEKAFSPEVSCKKDLDSILKGDILVEDLLSKGPKYLELLQEALKNFRDDRLSDLASKSDLEVGDKLVKTRRNQFTKANDALKVLEKHLSSKKELN